MRGRERFGEKGGGRNRRKKGRRGAAWWWPPTAGLLLELRELLLLAGVLGAGAAWAQRGRGRAGSRKAGGDWVALKLRRKWAAALG